MQLEISTVQLQQAPLPVTVYERLLYGSLTLPANRSADAAYLSSSIFKSPKVLHFYPLCATMSTADALPTPDVEAKDVKDTKEKRGEKRSADAEVTNGDTEQAKKHLKGTENGEDYEDEEDVNEEDDDDDDEEEPEEEGDGEDDDDEEDDTNDVPEEDDEDDDEE